MPGESLVCPGCGALLPHPDDKGRSTCLSCGRIVEVEDEPRPEPTPAGPGGFSFTVTHGPDGSTTTVSGGGIPDLGDLTVPPAATRTAKRAGLGCGLGIVLLTGLIIGGVLLLVNGASESVQKALGISSSVSPTSGSSAVVALGEHGEIGTVTMVYDAKHDSRSVARLTFGGDAAELKWRTPDLPKDVYDIVAAADGDVVYVGAGDEVWAIDAATGKRRWVGALPDKVSTSCPSCFQAVGGTLVVQTTDGTVTAFAKGSAEPRWVRRLVSPAARMQRAGDLVVIADEAKSTEPGQVATLDPATGTVVHTQTPTCPATDSMWALDLSPGAPVLGVPGTGDVVAVFGAGESCAVRWDARSGAVRWSTRLTGMSTVDRDTALITAKDLVLGTSDGMVRVDLATGARVDLQVPDDVRASPALVTGGLVVADTSTTRGSTRGGLAAFDPATGALRWSVRLPDDAQAASMDSSDALFDGSPRSVLVATPAGRLLVVVFDGTDRTYAVRPVDLKTGIIGRGEPRRFSTRYDSGTPSLTVEAVTPTRLLVSVDSLMQTIPLDPAGKIVTFPDAG